jgi:hypothetical protein
MPYIKAKRDQKEVIKLMRTYTDPRGRYGWSAQAAAKHISGENVQAESPAEPTWAQISTVSSRTILRWYAANAPRAPNLLPRTCHPQCAGDSDWIRRGRFKHWESYGELPCNATKTDAGKRTTWTRAHCDGLEEILVKQPLLYLDEMADELESRFHIRFPLTSISAQLARLGYSRKVVYEKASQAILAEQHDFIASMHHYLHNPEMAIFVDESNKDRVAAKRKYGWSKVGTPVNFKVKFNRDYRYTLIAAADCFGFVSAACETVRHAYKEKVEDQPVDEQRFVQYVREILCPVLGNFNLREARSVVIMDNCSIHMHHHVRELIEAKGAIIIYSAPYSPELIPIEYMFKSWKDHLKRCHLDFAKDWHSVHHAALNSVTPEMGLNFFRKTTLTELVDNHPLSKEYAEMGESVAALFAVGILQ